MSDVEVGPVDPTGIADDAVRVELTHEDGSSDAEGRLQALAAPDAKGPAEAVVYVREVDGGARYEVEDRWGTVVSVGPLQADVDAALAGANEFAAGLENVTHVEVETVWPEAPVVVTIPVAELAELRARLAALEGDKS